MPLPAALTAPHASSLVSHTIALWCTGVMAEYRPNLLSGGIGYISVIIGSVRPRLASYGERSKARRRKGKKHREKSTLPFPGPSSLLLQSPLSLLQILTTSINYHFSSLSTTALIIMSMFRSARALTSTLRAAQVRSTVVVVS